jgi:hypothetical protein
MKIGRLFLTACILGAFIFGGQKTFAEDRSYSYDSIIYHINVNKDTTVDVSEDETFRFIGEYHKGYRDIPIKKFDLIDNVYVFDGTTGKPFVYSDRQLDKLDPSSWGEYTYYEKGGSSIIEWY